MDVEITYGSLRGLATVKHHGRILECHSRPDGVFLLSPPIPTVVCEHLHTLNIKLCNVVRRMPKESLLMHPWVIISLRDSGVKGFFPLNLREKVQDSRLVDTTICFFMSVLKMSEEDSLNFLSKIGIESTHAFVMHMGSHLLDLQAYIAHTERKKQACRQ
uniref:Uncharacterized protein n=1 Tax=Biomphalaria glabrata TaxID=6526 RepID=A0A2C9LM43_BIOGL